MKNLVDKMCPFATGNSLLLLSKKIPSLAMKGIYQLAGLSSIYPANSFLPAVDWLSTDRRSNKLPMRSKSVNYCMESLGMRVTNGDELLNRPNRISA
jgi:hypothetical protein